MRTGLICKLLGLLLMIFSLSYICPVGVSLLYQDGKVPVFLYAFLLTFSGGALLWIPNARRAGELRVRDGFMLTVLFWFVLGLASALPFLLSAAPAMSITDAVFESISGLTTTGATVLSGLDSLPKSLLFYRQLLQWMGGIGIVVIAVAILPLLGVGGMQIYRAQTPGPVKDNKLTPRIAETAKALAAIYGVLTVACAALYWLGGMSAFDAIAHAFSTVSIGGFSTHDASMAHFTAQPDINGDFIIAVCMGFMVVSGLNFALHYYCFARRTLGHYARDAETRLYFGLLAVAAVAVSFSLFAWGTYDAGDGLRHGVFQTVSVMTTTGFTTEDFSAWPLHIAFVLIVLSFFGACAGSTGGGIKIGRMLILARQSLREITRLIHPNAVLPVKVDERPIPPRIADAIWGFFGVYLIVFYLMTIVLLATGLDFITAWSAVAATLNNLGPGLGEVGSNYAGLNAPAKWVLCLSMLLGRLELFTLIVLFVPAYWRS
ncbi:MAG: potassium transporter [Cellvibrionales bacterium]|nr:potassium transporter [Cellvibrionales bacterium]